MRENGIDVGSTYRLQIHFIYVSDLKNIYSIFDNVNCCPLCTCKTDEVWRFDCDMVTAFTGAIEIKIDSYCICLLHMKQRITESLICMIGGTSMENKVRIMKNINSFPYLKNYGWKKLEDKSKKKEDQTKQKVDKKLEERRLQKPNQIRGYCVDILLNDLNKLFEGISDAPHHKSI